MTRKVALLALAISWAGCSNGSQGGVSFRWRILDRCTGGTFDPASSFDPATGACTDTGWRVDVVRLIGVQLDVDAGAPLVQFDFLCRQREATTPFAIPGGLYDLSIRGLRPGTATIAECPEAVSPPPLERTVKDAEITNLDVIQLDVSTCTPPPPGC